MLGWKVQIFVTPEKYLLMYSNVKYEYLFTSTYAVIVVHRTTEDT